MSFTGSSTDSSGFDISVIVCNGAAGTIWDGMLRAGCAGGGRLSLASCRRCATALDFKWLWFSAGGALIRTTLSRALVAGKFYLQPLGGNLSGESCWMDRTWGKGRAGGR